MQCQPCKTDDKTLGRKGVLKGKRTELCKGGCFLQSLHKTTDDYHSKAVLFSDALSFWVAEMFRGAGTSTLQLLIQPQTAVNNQGWDFTSFLHVYTNTLPSPCMGGLIHQSKPVQPNPAPIFPEERDSASRHVYISSWSMSWDFSHPDPCTWGKWRSLDM